MFGFLFKRSKNGEKDSSKQGRRCSKELLSSSLHPSREPADNNSSVNSVSVSTNSLSPSASESTKDSGFVSIDNDDPEQDHSIPSLTPTTVGECFTGVRVSIGPEAEDIIEFIDDEQSDFDNTSSNAPINDTTSAVCEPQVQPVVVDSFECCSDSKRQLKEGERKAMVQLDAIRSKLISKETELSLLQADINMLAVDRDDKAMEVQSLTAHLDILKSENELALKRIHEFEIQLEELRFKNSQLSEQVLKKSEQLKCLRDEHLSKPLECEELNGKIKALEDKIDKLESEKRELSKNLELIEKEKSSQIKALQDALEDALETKIKLQTKYEKELQDLQQSNSCLVDDFEWKLHEVEAACRKKLLEKDQQLKEKINEAKVTSSTNFAAEKSKLDEERKSICQQLRQVQHLKSFETEVIQLQGVTCEQQKSLRAASRQLDQLKGNERLLQDEIASLKTLLEKEKSHSIVLKSSTQRRIDAQEQSVLEQLQKQKLDLNSKWDVKLKEECSKVKNEVIEVHTEEMRKVVEAMNAKKDREMKTANETWNRTRQELLNEIVKLKDEMKATEFTHQKELSKATTIIDRDNWELRRKLTKLCDANMEEIELLKNSHSEEMDRLRERYDKALIELTELERKVQEFEKTSRSTDSVETEKDSGIVVNVSSKSIVDGTGNEDSECSSDSEDESEDDDEVEVEGSDDDEDDVETRGGSKNKENAILELREEVATLQDSIDTLTLNLNESALNVGVQKGTPNLVKGNQVSTVSSEGDNSSSLKSSTENESSAVSDTDNESDLRPFFLIGVIPILSYTYFQSILVVFWTYFVLIVYRILLGDIKNRRLN